MTPSMGPEGPSHQPAIPPEAAARGGRGAEVLEAALTGSEYTRNTYITQWNAFADWCDAGGLNPLPASPDTVVRYLETLAKSRPRSRSSPSFATLRLVASVITKVHDLAGHRSPCKDRSVRDILKKLQFTLTQPRVDVGALAPVNCNFIATHANDRRRRGRGRETEARAAQRGRVDVALACVLSGPA